MAIIDFRLSFAFHFRPILHSFPTELLSLQRKNNYSTRQAAILHRKSSHFQVILSIRSEFYQIGTPHFSLEGVGRKGMWEEGGQNKKSDNTTPCELNKAHSVPNV